MIQTIKLWRTAAVAWAFWLIVTVSLALSGCARAPNYIARTCLPKPVPARAYVFDTLDPLADLYRQTQALLADRETAKAEISELRASISGVTCEP